MTIFPSLNLWKCFVCAHCVSDLMNKKTISGKIHLNAVHHSSSTDPVVSALDECLPATETLPARSTIPEDGMWKRREKVKDKHLTEDRILKKKKKKKKKKKTNRPEKP